MRKKPEMTEEQQKEREINELIMTEDLLPENHKAKWFAGAALTTTEDTRPLTANLSAD